MMASIETRDLTRLFKVGKTEVRALDGVNLDIEKGGFAAVVGPSGSGKSTLLALLGGLDTPSSGTIIVNNRRLDQMSAHELAAYRLSSVGFIFQDFFLLGHLTALENVEVPLKLMGVDRRTRRARASELLETVGLSGRSHHRPREMAGGERQRTAMARALANRPALVLADEPTGNLDSVTGKEITDTLARLNKEQGITLLAVTHNLAVAAMADKRYTLVDGRITAEAEQNSGEAVR
jgi:putative ABC transport system ATP-binding protein